MRKSKKKWPSVCPVFQWFDFSTKWIVLRSEMTGVNNLKSRKCISISELDSILMRLIGIGHKVERHKFFAGYSRTKKPVHLKPSFNTSIRLSKVDTDMHLPISQKIQSIFDWNGIVLKYSTLNRWPSALHPGQAHTAHTLDGCLFFQIVFVSSKTE